MGSSCGLHGPYIFYKAFKCHSLDGKPRILSLGDFFLVRCKPGDPICIAELQLLWEERTSKQLLSSSKLYFLPEDTPKGRSASHGEVSMSTCTTIILLYTCFGSCCAGFTSDAVLMFSCPHACSLVLLLNDTFMALCLLAWLPLPQLSVCMAVVNTHKRVH